MKNKSIIEQYFNVVVITLLTNLIRFAISIPMRFFWAMFTFLTIFALGLIAEDLLFFESKDFGQAFGFFLAILIAPAEFIIMLITQKGYSFHGGFIELIGAAGVWLATFEFLHVVRKKIFPLKSDAFSGDIWKSYRTKIKFVAGIFIFCVIANLIFGNFEEVSLYIILNIFFSPLSLFIPLYQTFDQSPKVEVLNAKEFKK